MQNYILFHFIFLNSTNLIIFSGLKRIEKELEFRKEIEYLPAKDDDKINIHQANIIIKSYSFIFFLIRREERVLTFALDGRRNIKLKLWEGKHLIFLQLMGYFC